MLSQLAPPSRLTAIRNSVSLLLRSSQLRSNRTCPKIGYAQVTGSRRWFDPGGYVYGIAVLRIAFSIGRTNFEEVARTRVQVLNAESCRIGCEHSNIVPVGSTITADCNTELGFIVAQIIPIEINGTGPKIGDAQITGSRRWFDPGGYVYGIAVLRIAFSIGRTNFEEVARTRFKFSTRNPVELAASTPILSQLAPPSRLIAIRNSVSLLLRSSQLRSMVTGPKIGDAQITGSRRWFDPGGYVYGIAVFRIAFSIGRTNFEEVARTRVQVLNAEPCRVGCNHSDVVPVGSISTHRDAILKDQA